ncbi:Uncharacterised protein [Mycobacteroides abscessus subsp. abscessus]|nr:Uncharacterised protein [Mycobacteroides abscessus subsp. abscessus]
MASTTSLTVPPKALPASLIRAIDQVCAANRRAPPIETFSIVCGAESGLTSWGSESALTMLLLARLLAGAHTAWQSRASGSSDSERIIIRKAPTPSITAWCILV